MRRYPGQGCGHCDEDPQHEGLKDPNVALTAPLLPPALHIVHRGLVIIWVSSDPQRSRVKFFPSFVLLGGVRNFKRWGLVGGLRHLGACPGSRPQSLPLSVCILAMRWTAVLHHVPPVMRSHDVPPVPIHSRPHTPTGLRRTGLPNG